MPKPRPAARRAGGRLRGDLDRARRLGLRENVSPAVFATQHREIFGAIVGGNVPVADAAELFATDASTVPVRRNVVVRE